MLQQVERAHTITILWKMHREKENQGQNLHCGTSLKTTRALIFCSIFYYTDAFPNTNQISFQNSIKSRSLNLGAFLFILFYKPCHIQLITMQSNCYHFFFFVDVSLFCQAARVKHKKLMNTSVKSQFLKHLQVCQAHVTLTATVLEWKTWTDADVGETSFQLLASNTLKRTEPEQISTTVGCSTECYEVLWLKL